MCIQDLKIVQRTTMRKATLAGNNTSIVQLPDMSRALWFRVAKMGAPTAVYWNSSLQVEDKLPIDERFGDTTLQYFYYSREQCGGAFIRGMFIELSAGEEALVNWQDVDYEVAHLLVQPM